MCLSEGLPKSGRSARLGGHLMASRILSLIFGLLALSVETLAQDSLSLEKAREALVHANTYHWLARYKNSDSRDFLASRQWFEQAIALTGDNHSAEAEKIREIAESGIAESDIRYENNFDNIMNDYPLFQVLNGLNNTYEMFDDPDVVAASAALENAIGGLRYAGLIKDYQMMVVMTSDPINKALEDELHFIVNQYGNYFYRPVEEQLDVLSREEVKSIYGLPGNRAGLAALKKLGDAWDQRYLVNVKLIENDIVGDVNYFGAWFYLWDVQSGQLVKSLYADGFAEDRRYINGQITIVLFIAGLLVICLPLVFKYVYSFVFRTDLRSVHLYTSLYAFAMTLAMHYPIVTAFKAWAPDPGTLTILPMNRLWIYALVSTFAIVPPVLVYLIGTRVPGIRDRLSDGESIASLAAGTLIGNLTHLTLVHVTRFSFEGLNFYYVLSLLTIAVTSLYIGIGISNKFHKDINRDLISIPIYVLVAALMMLGLLGNDNLYFIFAIVVGVATPLFAISYSKVVEYLLGKKKNAIEDAAYIDVLDKERFSELLNHPLNFISPLPARDIRKEVGSYFTEIIRSGVNGGAGKDKLHVLLISGPQGCGKTRLAREIGQEVVDHYNAVHGVTEGDPAAGNWVLFGDCDEMGQEGPGIQFEPFSQAMHSILGSGRFEPPLKRANKIKAGFEKLGMDQVMDSAGLGVLNNILGSGSESDEVTSATTTEMADIVEKALVRLAEERPVVFIIDDTQWIDEATFSLFNELLKKLVAISDPPGIYFVVTARVEKEGAEQAENKLVDTLKTFGPNKLISLMETRSDHFLEPSRFEEFLSRGLYLDSVSARKIALYLNRYEVDNVSQVIQAVNQILKADGIQFENSLAFLKKGFQLENMEPPSSAIAQVTQLLKTIGPEERRILECAAFIGTEFNATILSNALNEKRLSVLASLRELESNGLIVDILDQDDVYRFSSSMILNGIRYITSNAQAGSTDNMSQIVREYHFCVTQAIEKQFNVSTEEVPDTSAIDDHTLYRLAKRSKAAGEQMAERALHYNIAAQARATKSSQYHNSILFGRNALISAEKFGVASLQASMIESIFSTMRGMIYTNTNPAQIKSFYQSAGPIISTKSVQNRANHLLMLKCLFADAIIHDFSDSYVGEIATTVDDINAHLTADGDSISPVNRVFAELSLIRLKRETDKEDHQSLKKLKGLLNEIDGIEQAEGDEFVLRIKSEVIEELLKIELEDVVTGGQRRIKPEQWRTLLDDGKKLKVSVDDKEGLSQLFLFDGEYCLNSQDHINASVAFSEALRLAIEVGSMDFASDAHTGLGKIDLVNQNYKDALVKFSKATVESKIDNNIPNQYAALNGVFSVAIQLEDQEIIKEFSDEVVSLFSMDQNRQSDDQYHRLVELLKDCVSFAPEVESLIT